MTHDSKGEALFVVFSGFQILCPTHMVLLLASNGESVELEESGREERVRCNTGARRLVLLNVRLNDGNGWTQHVSESNWVASVASIYVE